MDFYVIIACGLFYMWISVAKNAVIKDIAVLFSDESFQKKECATDFVSYMFSDLTDSKSCIPPRSDYYIVHATNEAPPAVCWTIAPSERVSITMRDGTVRLFQCSSP